MKMGEVGLMHGVRIGALFFLVGLAVCGFGLALPACGTGEMWFTNADAGADVDASPDAADDMCPADECVTVPAGWDRPYLLWTGPNGQEPLCPYDAPYGEAHHAYDDLVA